MFANKSGGIGQAEWDIGQLFWTLCRSRLTLKFSQGESSGGVVQRGSGGTRERTLDFDPMPTVPRGWNRVRFVVAYSHA